MCIYFVLNKYYYIIILYGGSHASDILHVLMGVSVAKLIIYNIVLLFICHNKRSSSSSSERTATLGREVKLICLPSDSMGDSGHMKVTLVYLFIIPFMKKYKQF